MTAGWALREIERVFPGERRVLAAKRAEEAGERIGNDDAVVDGLRRRCVAEYTSAEPM